MNSKKGLDLLKRAWSIGRFCENPDSAAPIFSIV